MLTTGLLLLPLPGVVVAQAGQTLEVEVKVTVDRVLRTDVIGVPPDEAGMVDVTGHVVTVSYVTRVVVPSWLATGEALDMPERWDGFVGITGVLEDAFHGVALVLGARTLEDWLGVEDLTVNADVDDTTVVDLNVELTEVDTGVDSIGIDAGVDEVTPNELEAAKDPDPADPDSVLVSVDAGVDLAGIDVVKLELAGVGVTDVAVELKLREDPGKDEAELDPIPNPDDGIGSMDPEGSAFVLVLVLALQELALTVPYVEELGGQMVVENGIVENCTTSDRDCSGVCTGVDTDTDTGVVFDCACDSGSGVHVEVNTGVGVGVETDPEASETDEAGQSVTVGSQLVTVTLSVAYSVDS